MITLEEISKEVDFKIIQDVVWRETGEDLTTAARWLDPSRMQEELPSTVVSEIFNAADAVDRGVPLQYATRISHFMGRRYLINDQVLIPRPETEVLVESIKESFDPLQPLRGYEFGIGSGVIAAELLAHFYHLDWIACDINAEVISLAEKNVRTAVSPNEMHRAHFFVNETQFVYPPSAIPLRKQFDFIVSNPPYLSNEGDCESDVFQSEPHAALFPPEGCGPNFFYEQFARNSLSYLKDGGKVFLEIPHERAEEIREMFISSDWRVTLKEDLNHRPRVLVAQHG